MSPSSPSANPAPFLRPLLEECGYTGTRLKEGYAFDSVIIPYAGFATKPWDFDSACIAVMVSDGDSKATAHSCRGMGAPIVWVQHNGTVDWWMLHDVGPTLYKSRPAQKFAELVHQHKDQLDPARVYRGKTIARVNTSRQLDFVDAGLLALLREEAGKKLHDLVEEMTRVTLDELGGGEPSRATLRRVFTAVFRLLAGKILKDKGVRGFKGLDLANPTDVLAAVEKHYSAGQARHSITGKWKTALTSAASSLNGASDFSVVSPETLAYVYEHTLVTKALRKKLGIHATPPWLVDYMVWRLDDWIREIPIADRHVFEPACGHAPFLLSAMRTLRLDMHDGDETKVHEYLKSHTHGLEYDDFAREIARLSLTLADEPYPNGWQLQDGDMYASDVLMGEAAKCGILLCNPPFEKFDKGDKSRYERAGHRVTHKKAVELLHRTLDRLRPGSVFGVVVPQTVVSGPEAKAIREVLLREFEIAEVCLFPGKVFQFAQIETAIILGRRRQIDQDLRSHRVRFRAVGEHGIAAFRHKYAVDSDTTEAQGRLSENPALELKVSALDEVWQHLRQNRRLRDVALVGRGIEYKGQDDRNGVVAVVSKPKPGYVPGYSGVSRDQLIFACPPKCWLAVGPELVSNPGQGEETGKPQILVNRGRTARSPWRIKAMLDTEGGRVKDNFVVVRPKAGGVSALYLWAVLNSPIANAFVASRTMRKHNYEGLLREVPMPCTDATDMDKVASVAIRYREMASARAYTQQRQDRIERGSLPLFDQPEQIPPGPTELEVREALLTLDAAVLRLYDLPPRLERMVLDYFARYERRGVGCDFEGYYPPGFTSYLPLHMVISEGFQRARADATVARFQPGESEFVRDMLRAAAAGTPEE